MLPAPPLDASRLHQVSKPSDRLLANSWTNRGGGAAAEVQAARFRSERYERRIVELEKDVERARRDFGDLKTVVVASAFLASVGVFGVAGTVNVQWGEELSFDTALMGLLGNSGIA